MPQQPIDLETIRQAWATLDTALRDHPELGEHHPERWEALEQWRQEHLEEEHTMARKPTGRPPGRPKTKEYATLLARVPQEFVDRVKTYARVHRQSISELIRDGLAWRITGGDPRAQVLYDNPTPGEDDRETSVGVCAGREQQRKKP
jgi:hypothetical protein